MTNLGQPPAALTCTAFDGARRIASGSYLDVALALGDYGRKHADASMLAFDNASGKQIDFDLSGSDAEIVVRLAKRFPGVEASTPRAPGRPKLGVTAREVTLLPRHWEWLAGQPGGASVTLRKLVEDARRAGPSSKVLMHKLHERAYHFMSAIAGDRAGFEEATRALFADDRGRLATLIASWPKDIREHITRLAFGEARPGETK